jgi:hypothetical protein
MWMLFAVTVLANAAQVVDRIFTASGARNDVVGVEPFLLMLIFCTFTT